MYKIYIYIFYDDEMEMKERAIWEWKNNGINGIVRGEIKKVIRVYDVWQLVDLVLVNVAFRVGETCIKKVSEQHMLRWSRGYCFIA